MPQPWLGSRAPGDAGPAEVHLQRIQTHMQAMAQQCSQAEERIRTSSGDGNAGAGGTHSQCTEHKLSKQESQVWLIQP